MDKMRMESVDITDQNIDKIASLFPSCITEAKDENGKLKKAINFDMLRQLLSKDVAEGDEAYEFTWVGKKNAIIEANTPIRKTLRPCKEESVNWDTTENLYIEGDNLEVLKLLQESYLGKVKMIYIDPPYNTGNDFIYDDDFRQSRNEYNEDSGAVDENGDRMFKNTDSNGRFHSDWCSMIKTRLSLARNLLTNDGIIFISNDENEYVNLKKICDEVFGDENFIENFIWIKNATKNNSLTTSTNHEYILCYSKSIKDVRQNKNMFRVKKKGKEEVENLIKQLRDENPSYTPEYIQERLRLYYSSHSELKGISAYRFIDENYEVYASDNLSAPGGNGATFEIIHPQTNKPCKISSRGWAYKKERIEELLSNNAILFGKDDSTVPRLKRFLKDMDTDVVTSIIENNDDGEKEVRRLFGRDKSPFENPKPTSLVKYLQSFTIQEDDIVLDFFGGSSTTADSVMQANVTDNSRIKYIMVQIPEKSDEKSEAFKAGYSTICEIGKERIRRAAKKIHEEHPDAKFDDGFRVLKVADSNMTDVYYSVDDYNQNMLTQLESNIKPDRTDMDLLFGCLLEWGLPLSMPYTSEKIEDCTVHTYNAGDLIACFDESIPDEVIKEIAKRQPLRAVFRDSSFKNSPSKINVTEIFKMLSPDTSVKVI